MLKRNSQVTALLLLALAAKSPVGQVGSADLTIDMQAGVSSGTTSGSSGVYVFTNLHPTFTRLTSKTSIASRH